MANPLFVLVVEDEPVDFELVARGLERSGVKAKCQRVDTEKDYIEALERLPDIIISDYVLPSFGALHALQLLKESDLDIPLIVLTGMVSEETVVESMKHGASDYLLKDRMARLGPAVGRAMEERDLRAEKKLAEENARRERALKDAGALIGLELEQFNRELQNSNRRLKETQAQLVHQEKMASLGQLVAGIAHEINNPLAFVVNNLFLVESGLESLSAEMEAQLSGASGAKLGKVRTRLAEMGSGLKRVKELVLDLRTFSRLDEGEFKTVDIVEAIETVLLLLNHKLTGRIQVQKDYGEQRWLCCHAGRLNQVFMNLIANAVDAVGETGTIYIRTSQDSGSFVISVRDTGAGIPEAIRSKIFDPFFTTKAVGEGTGLGLSISYGIVRDHGGSIEVVSEEGRGAEFIIRIPQNLEGPKVS